MFTIAIAVYFNYTGDSANFQGDSLDDMAVYANSISTSLLEQGYPNDWTNSSVIRVGITNDMILNSTKVKRAKEINYTTSRQLFGSKYDFSVIFVDKNGRLVNVSNVCDLGILASMNEGMCNPEYMSNLNISSKNPSKLAKVERYISFNGEILKMVVSVWQ